MGYNSIPLVIIDHYTTVRVDTCKGKGGLQYALPSVSINQILHKQGCINVRIYYILIME